MVAHNPELRVNVSLGLTVPIPGLDFGMIKPSIGVEGINPSLPIDEQIEEALATAKVALEASSDSLSGYLATLTPPDKIRDLENTLVSVRSRLNDLIARMNAFFKNEATVAAEAAAAEENGSAG